MVTPALLNATSPYPPVDPSLAIDVPPEVSSAKVKVPAPVPPVGVNVTAPLASGLVGSFAPGSQTEFPVSPDCPAVRVGCPELMVTFAVAEVHPVMRSVTMRM